MRSEREIAEEEEVAKRIKKLYKLAKAEKKRKQKEMIDKAYQEQQQQQHNSLPTGLIRPSPGPTDQENEEDADYESESDTERAKSVDPVDVELHEAFLAFSSKHKLPHDSLRSALIQVFNEVIDKSILESCLAKIGPYEPHNSTQSLETNATLDLSNGLSFHQFKTLYYLILDYQTAAESNDSNNNNNNNNNNENNLSSSSALLERSLYWQSSEGSLVHESMGNAPVPLDLRTIDWGSTSTHDAISEDGSSESLLLVSDYPAGSAIGVARKKHGNIKKK